uniref:BPI2 domain-containing protein n=1 Tax=Globodera pallida TaxID=36090 RepID=A0A183BNM9_GLOPA
MFFFAPLFFLLVVPAFCAATPPQPADPPTLALRLSPRGLAFFSSIGHHIVEKELPAVRFPPISLPINAGPGSGRVYANHLRIPADRFQSPHFRFSLTPPNALQFRSQDGHINVRGLWSARYYLLNIPFFSSGWVDLLATDIRMILSMGLVHSGVHPQLRMFNCTADIGQMDVQIGGGVIPWLVNLFRAELSETLRETLHDQLCAILQNNIVSQLNTLLASFPLSLPIGDGLFVQYAFSQDAQVTGTFLQASAFVELTVPDSLAPVPSACPLSAPASLALTPPATMPMASLWMDRTLLDCLCRSVHRSRVVQFVIGPSFDGGHFAKFLRTSCAFFQLCIGRFFPILSRSHPDQQLDLRFHSANVPSISFMPAERSLNLTAALFMDMHIHPWTEHAEQVLARLEMNISAELEPRLEDGRVGGSLKDGIMVQFAEVNSTIGNFSQKFLDTFDLLFKPVLEVALQSVLHVGIPLPTLEGIKMGNASSLTVLARELRVDAELVYAADGNVTEAFNDYPFTF